MQVISLQYELITFLSPTAIFEALRKLERYVKKQLENKQKGGIHNRIIYRWQGSVPSEALVSLLLYTAFEDSNRLLSSKLGFYIFEHEQILRTISDFQNTLAWEEPACYTMAAMDSQIQVYCAVVFELLYALLKWPRITGICI